MSDEFKERLKIVENAIFGDRENLEEMPGVISDIRCMRIELGEVSSNMKKVVGLVFMMFLTALGGLVFKGVASDAPSASQIGQSASNQAKP